MKPRFFGQFLLERGAVTSEALLDALRHQVKTNVPLGLLALERKMLTPEQYTQVQVEAFSAGRGFWEAALAKQLLTKPQIVELLGQQVTGWKLLGETLVDRGHLTREALAELTEAFSRDQERTRSQIETALASLPFPGVLRALHDVTTDLFQRMLGLPVRTTAMSVSPAATARCDVRLLAAQQIVGDRPLSYALALPEPLTLFVASHLLGEEQRVESEAVLDAVCEFVNMVVGHGCIRLEQEGLRASPKPPRVFRRGHPLPVANRSVQAEMTCPQGEFQVRYDFLAA